MLTRPTADLDTGASMCDTMRRHAFAACDGELTLEERAAVDSHLAECAACRARYAADATFHCVIRAAIAPTPAPDSLRDRILLFMTTRTAVNAPA